MRTAEEIVTIWRQRRDKADIATQRMRKIRDVYNGDLVLPYSGKEEPAVANMILTGVDQTAGRIASVVPQIWFPPTRPGFDASEKRAADRRAAVMGWWDDNRMPAMLRQRARYLIAYGKSPTVLYPEYSQYLPKWRTVNPLGCYEAEDLAEPLIPADVICAYNKPWGWIRRQYPWLVDRVATEDYDDDQQAVLLEYCDEEAIRLIFAGIDPTWEPGQLTTQWETNTWGGYVDDLVTPIENRAHRPLGVVANRITLDRRQGQFDQMIGMYEAQARLTALEITAVERDIFPDTYLISRPGEVATFHRGPYDGRTGEVNIITGGDVQALKNPPGYQTQPMIDRLERSQRITSGVPPEFGGESTTNIRTGRRGDAVLSAVIDYPIAEAQEAFAEALQQENRVAIAIARAWWGDDKVTYHYTERGRMHQGSYVPNQVFSETDYHKISNPVAGTDLNALVVGMGQRVGLGTLSRRTAAELDPLIDDPEQERDRITAEGLETAMMSSIQTAAANGAIPPEVVARVSELVRSGQAELPQALAQATAEYQATQQAQAAPAAPTGAEELMAEVAAGATGAPAGIPQVPETGQSLQNLSGLMTALRKTNTREAGRAALGGNY